MKINIDYNAKFSDQYLVSIQTKQMIEHKKYVTSPLYLPNIPEFNRMQVVKMNGRSIMTSLMNRIGTN